MSRFSNSFPHSPCTHLQLWSLGAPYTVFSLAQTHIAEFYNSSRPTTPVLESYSFHSGDLFCQNPLKWPRIHMYILEKARFTICWRINPGNSEEKPGFISLNNVNPPLFTSYWRINPEILRCFGIYTHLIHFCLGFIWFYIAIKLFGMPLDKYP
jgi:hypothetical protein